MTHQPQLSQAASPTTGLDAMLRGVFARHRFLHGYVLLSPTMLLLVVALCLPVGTLVLYSFWTQTYLTIDRTFTLDNYAGVLGHSGYLWIIAKSLIISMVVTLTTLVLAYPIAYYLAFKVQSHKIIWLILITVPFWTSYLLRVFAWKVILGYNGVINSALIFTGLIDQPLEFLLYNPIAVVITLAHAWAPVAILPIFVSLDKIDRSFLEAATDLGDGPFERFLRITLPLSMPGVVAAGMLVFIPTVGDYITPQLVGGPNGVMIGNMIQIQFGKANNWPFGSTLAIVTAAAITVASLLIWIGSKRIQGGRR